MYLLFLDESGHDHRNTPYEVNGGIVLHIAKLWPFVQALVSLEQSTFGDRVQRFRKEFKGCKLIDKSRMKWAAQAPMMDDATRRTHCLGFFNKGLNRQRPTRAEFTAYGQACLLMARGIFDLLSSHDAQILVPVPEIPTGRIPEILSGLRKETGDESREGGGV
ncbi:MAG: DUF3800 domain-containing protein [Candidatus Binatia bacterium]|jgi:hypothetical protein